MNRSEIYYIGLDIHKKTVAYCIKQADGQVVEEGTLQARKRELKAWAEGMKHPWIGGMEATMFSDWVYAVLVPYGVEVKVGNTFRMKAIAASKKKSDKLDARALADLLRCDWFPECYMSPAWNRELKQTLRYRNLLVRVAVRFKNRTAGLLMQGGVEYNKKKLHQKGYFSEMLAGLDETPESVKHLLKMGHQQIRLFDSLQQELVKGLLNHPNLAERVERLQSIKGVGPITSLTWALEIGDPKRFHSIRQAVSYCGLCPGHYESAGKVQKSGISKQRNPHLQSILIEAAKLAPMFNEELRAFHQQQIDKGAAANTATLEVARKLVAYLLAVDKREKPFEVRKT